MIRIDCTCKQTKLTYLPAPYSLCEAIERLIIEASPALLISSNRVPEVTFQRRMSPDNEAVIRRTLERCREETGAVCERVWRRRWWVVGDHSRTVLRGK